MSEPAQPGAVPTCYRHPDREAYIKCQRCGRVICPDCMRDSAVGFQCPECVKEGSRATRSGRTAYGGLRPTNAGITSMVIIAINIAGLGASLSPPADTAARSWSGSSCDRRGCAWSRRASSTATACHALGVAPCCPGVADGAYWQLVTSTFSHVAIWHLGFNMLAIWVLGPQLELAIGRTRFIALFLLSGLAGSTLVYWVGPEYTRFGTLGASGAVFGLMGALLVIAYKVKADVQQILIWIGINAVLTFTIPNISWQGHLGGLLGGMLIAAILVYAPRQRRTQVQVVGLALFALLLVVAIAARTASLTA